jgi:hypothetical protein
MGGFPLPLLKDGSATGLRPPYLEKFETTTEPLVVLPAFLSRADSTAASARPRDPKNVVDSSGQPIAEPSERPDQLAFEADPNLNYEKWDEYWRKVHGMRFTYEEGPDDRSMALMLRYDQVHRVPGGPTSFFPPPYQAPVDANGQLFDHVIGNIPAYRRPTYDGFAYMAFHTIEDLTISFGYGKFPAKIVPEERVMFRSVPHLITREHILKASPIHRDPISLIKVHVRKSSARQAFQEKWLFEHGKTVMGLPATHRYVTRYAQLHNIGPAKEGELFWHPVGSRWDGITVMSFACMADLEDFLMTDDYAAIDADELEYVDPKQSEYWSALNYNIINRIYPEQETVRP